MVVFRDEGAAEILQNAKIRKTTLTEYFSANKEASNHAANGQQMQFECRGLLYQEFPMLMTWNARGHNGILRKVRFSAMGRMIYISPAAGERFYLRLLLTAISDATSFTDL